MKLLWWTLAGILLLLGFATVWLPIPTGVPLMAAGLILIIATSRAAARRLRKRRQRGTRLNRAMVWIEERAPHRLARILRRTRPRKLLEDVPPPAEAQETAPR